MIEREVATDEDRTRVAGILWKRLEKKIPLQVDATIIYLKAQQGIPKSRWLPISNGDLKLDSPYNTYRWPGLPPGPIANPGRASLYATLYPDPVDYLFFVSRNDGTHYFSSSIREHNRAVAKYQQKRRVKK